jgi:hypothetical protein
MFLELYFDEDMALRTTPQDGPFAGLFEIQDQKRFEPCIQRLVELLTPSKQLLFVIPSTAPMTVSLRVSFEIPVGSKVKLLTSLLCGDREILSIVAADSPSGLKSLLGKETANVGEICALVSRRFFIPITQIKPDRDLNLAVSWTPLSGMSYCRTDFGGVADEFTVTFEKDIEVNGE